MTETRAAHRPINATPAIVVMGVAGCGKSAVGAALAARLGFDFVEGDRLHPPENVARMASGQPLTDELRAGWLDAIGARIAETRAAGRGVVATCSALKRGYRDRLRGFRSDIVFLYLEIDPATASRRVAGRKGHFMPASLVESQFAILEPPGADELAWTMDARRPVAAIVTATLKRLRQG